VRTVLLVDDSPGVREVLRILAEGQLEVVGEAADGAQAVELAERLRPDAIVLDQEMPVMTGLQALPRLRQRSPRSLIVFYAAKAAPETAEQGLAGGARAWIDKSQSPRSLVTHLVRLLEETERPTS
jgi:CheY-like chemotaxis protein